MDKKYEIQSQGSGKRGIINSHEYKDTVEDRQTVFLSQWKECQHRLWFSMRTYLEVGGTRQHQKKPLIQVTHDKSAFNAKDGKENGEREKGSHLFALSLRKRN